jgi:hypothetical protein
MTILPRKTLTDYNITIAIVPSHTLSHVDNAWHTGRRIWMEMVSTQSSVGVLRSKTDRLDWTRLD